MSSTATPSALSAISAGMIVCPKTETVLRIPEKHRVGKLLTQPFPHPPLLITMSPITSYQHLSSLSLNAVRSKKPNVLPGFRPTPKPKQKPISQMSVRELHDQHDRNMKLLSSPTASTSALSQRLTAEQVAIEKRLTELEGVEEIRIKLKDTSINADEEMSIDERTDSSISHAIDAKRRALAKYAPMSPNGSASIGSMSFQEAVELEQRAHASDRERHERIEAKRKRQGYPMADEILTRKEREARIWAFMNYKPTDSDLEDDGEEEEEDDDPSTWFEDDQDDGIKGQDIVHPDEEDLSNIIRIDDNHIPSDYNIFFDRRERDDW